MKPEEIVPPVDLCKKIPAGKFEDCALYWAQIVTGRYCVFTKDCGHCTIFDVSHKEEDSCPAPSLQEIMEDLPKDDGYNDLLLGHSEKVEKLAGWHIYYTGDQKRHCYDKNAATAALKLWLKMKGVEI